FVSGLQGLHKILSHTKNGLIVESFLDGKHRLIYASQKVSALVDISIYTTDEDVPLLEVFKLISEKEKGKTSLDHKLDPQKLRDYLSDLVKDLDHERVYNSDVAKLFQWYNQLVDKGLLNLEDDEDPTNDKKEGSPAKTKKPSAKKAVAAKSGPSKTASPKSGASKQTGMRKASGRKS
ncbi:MAG: DUF5606 domain-containing protein, partial [Vicingaceae bacterium]